MSRNEFMERLEYLLSDISQEEKADAIAYYRDYLEEAGEEAGRAMEDFGSPERIAAIIRSELAGNLADGGEFTERGYEDGRFREPNYQVAKRLDLPERDEGEKDGGAGGWQKAPQAPWEENQRPRAGGSNRIAFWILLPLVALLLWMGMGGVLMGIFALILALLFSALVFVGGMTLALLLMGAGLCAVGLLSMFKWLPGGLLMFGSGLASMGFGILGLLASMLFYGKFVPWIVRSVVGRIVRLLDEGR